MRRRPGRAKLAARVLAALALYPAPVAGPALAVLAGGANSQNTASAAADCHTVVVKLHHKHWVWVKKRGKIHGNRAVVRRHGKIVYVRVHRRYLRARWRRELGRPSPGWPARVGVAGASRLITGGELDSLPREAEASASVVVAPGFDYVQARRAVGG